MVLPFSMYIDSAFSSHPGYMSAWTAINVDHVRHGEDMLDTGQTSKKLEYIICKSFWWDYVIEVGKYMLWFYILQRTEVEWFKESRRASGTAGFSS